MKKKQNFIFELLVTSININLLECSEELNL
jgi:hypothetical protein